MRNVKYSIFLMLALFFISCGSYSALQSPSPEDQPERYQGLMSGQLEVDSSIVETDISFSEFDSIDAHGNMYDGTKYITVHFKIPFEGKYDGVTVGCMYQLDVLDIPIDKSNVTYPVEDLTTVFTTTYRWYWDVEGEENIEGSLEITELSLPEEDPWETCERIEEVGYIKGTLSMQGTYYLAQASPDDDPGEPYPFDMVLSSSFEATIPFDGCIE
jgi:hypothetical protein